MLGSSLAFIDGSVVNVALPALAHDLKVDPANLSWTINAYLLPLGVLILLGGTLGDHFGRRRLFLIGLSVFSLSSLACAVAPSLSWLLAARALQGAGAALLMPNSPALRQKLQSKRRVFQCVHKRRPQQRSRPLRLTPLLLALHLLRIAILLVFQRLQIVL